jgi:NADPH:quinone reductase-like Zn-dependent oxidoreductase
MKALVSKPHLLSRVATLALGKTIGGPAAEFTDVPEPAISPNEILVKVRAVALNPTDHMHIDAISPPGSIIGCDYAGEVFKVGSNAASAWSVGDRVAGVVHGGLFPDQGAFAEYLKIDSDLAWKVPDDVDDAAAATFGVSAVTAMLALNARLGLPYPGDKQDIRRQQTTPVIFIYAGSTAAGLLSIQVAKLAGYTVVTTASPHSTDLVKSYGADAVFDYHDPGVAAAITKQYPDISIAVDCFSKGQSFRISDEVLKNSKGKLITLLQPPKPKYPGIQHELILAYTLLGRPFQWLPPVGPKWPAIPDDRKALARFYAGLPQLVSDKKLRAPPIFLEEGGWNGILTGLDKLRAGKVSGGKMVVKL